MFTFVELPLELSAILSDQAKPRTLARVRGVRRPSKLRMNNEKTRVEETTRSVLAYKAYLQSAAPAIEGETGDGRTYKVCAFAHDLGLSIETTLKLLMEYFNPYCEPPWEEEDLRAKIENAFQYAKGEHGEGRENLVVSGEQAKAAEFPRQALTQTLKAGADSIHTLTQAPYGLGAQSILAAASLIAQGYIDLKLPYQNGDSSPTSLFFLTIASSGERKTACDKLALKAIKRYEKELCIQREFDLSVYKLRLETWKSHHKNPQTHKNNDFENPDMSVYTPEPQPPLEPFLTISEPTHEAIYKLFAVGQPSLGLFSSEGGQFLGGHAMNKENRMRTIAGLCDWWDGEPAKRTRAGEGNSALYGRRLSVHLMLQPGQVADSLLKDGLSKEQGLLSRCLISSPESTQGSRFYKDPMPLDLISLDLVQKNLGGLLEKELPLEGTRNSLNPRAIPLSKEAIQLFKVFHDEIESKLGLGKPYHSISGFANKAAEHACRLALVMEYIENPHLEELSAETLDRGIELARYYLDEALRLTGNGLFDTTDSKSLEQLQTFLKNWDEPYVSLSDIKQNGPHSLRQDVEKLFEHMKLLETLEQVSIHNDPVEIQGERRVKNIWKLHFN